MGARIGITHFHGGEPAAAVLSRADSACYAAKDAGRNRIHAYRPEKLAMRRHRTELEWVAQFHRAIRKGRMLLYAQRIT
ncbi:MAG: hypothetical protein J5I81_02870 [Nitrococcus mobilis]|nr:hypothetical protein [Nitrococcus mobilis]